MGAARELREQRSLGLWPRDDSSFVIPERSEGSFPQSLSSSLIEVFDRVRSSTVFTITAQ
jgi:hypothetical protein